MEREKTGIALAAEPEDRRMVFVMSDENPDRGGDVVKADGWQLANFQKNPVFLPMHQTDKYPLGVWERVWVEKKQLKGLVRFADKGTHPEADLAYSLYKQGIMNAVSVKFLGEEYEPNDHGGLTFNRQELLECSAVPVPANANALAIAKGYDRKTRELFLKDVAKAPDAAVEEPDEAQADGAAEEANDGIQISRESLETVLGNLGMKG